MEINKLVVGGLMVGCLAAAGAGGYLAMRQSAPAAEAATPATDATATPDTAQPVTASEGVIAPEPTAPAPTVTPTPATPSPVANATPTRRSETPAARPSRPAPSRPTTPPASQTTHASNTPPPTAGNGSMWESRPTVEPVTPTREPAEPPPPPAPEFVDLVVPSDSVLGLQVERAISSETANIEDRVDARVLRDIRVDGRVAIPAGSVVQGSVTEVDKGGKVRERAHLAIRFHTVVLADGTKLNLRTDAVMREGQSPSKESTAKIGGAAAGGAILGAILGGGKGAAIGGAIGAAGGTAATMAGGRNPAVLPAGTNLSVRIQQPVTVTVEKE